MQDDLFDETIATGDAIAPALSWARAVLDSDIDSTAKLVCLALDTYASRSQRVAFPGTERLAADVGKSVRTVQRALREAEDAGLLRVDERRTESGKQTTNLYVLAYSKASPVSRRGDMGVTLPPTSLDIERKDVREGPDVMGDANDVSIRRVWSYYVRAYSATYDARRASRLKLTKTRRSKIEARMRDDGYSVDELCEAIRGCFSRKHNVEGHYVDVELICRNQQKVEMYRQAAKLVESDRLPNLQDVKW